MKSLRRLIFEYLEPGDDGNKGERVVEFFIVLLILINVVAILLESYQDVYVRYSKYFDGLGIFSHRVFGGISDEDLVLCGASEN